MPQITLAATFARTELLTKAELAGVLHTREELLLGGLRDLAERQQAVRKAGKWLHPEQDFSGTPASAIEAQAGSVC